MISIHSKYVHIERGRIDRNVRYAGDLPCLAVWHEECFGRPEVLSVNLVEYGLIPPEGHVYVRDCSEHEGLPDALVEAGVAVKVRQVEFGPFDSTAWLMRVVA